eukprot:m.285716 g.285716  ORF g.285716 m.285716 type:complete len:50 (+) comp181014_c0_seq1:53-202(+)
MKLHTYANNRTDTCTYSQTNKHAAPSPPPLLLMRVVFLILSTTIFILSL